MVGVDPDGRLFGISKKSRIDHTRNTVYTDEKLKQDSIILNSTLTSPKTILELPTKNYVDIKIKDPSIIKNKDHVDFNDKNLDNVRWIKVNKRPAVEEYLTAKLYVDNALSDILSYVDNLHEINRNRRDLS